MPYGPLRFQTQRRTSIFLKCSVAQTTPNNSNPFVEYFVLWLFKNREANAIVNQFSPSHCSSVAPRPLCLILTSFLCQSDCSL